MRVNKILLKAFLLGTSLVYSGIAFSDSDDETETDDPIAANTKEADFGSGNVLGDDEAEEKKLIDQKRDLVKKVMALQKRISERSEDLNFENNRMGLLEAEVLTNLDFGCRANEPLKDLKIFIEGAHAPDKEMGRHKERRSGYGNPSVVQIQLGANIGFPIDEKERSVFHSNGRIVKTNFADLKVREIEFIKLAKSGTGYRNDEKRETKTKGGFLGIGSSKKTKIKYDIAETNRYQVNSIKIEVNGKILYERTGINRVLENGNLNLDLNDVKTNPRYLELMAEANCE